MVPTILKAFDSPTVDHASISMVWLKTTSSAPKCNVLGPRSIEAVLTCVNLLFDFLSGRNVPSADGRWEETLHLDYTQVC